MLKKLLSLTMVASLFALSACAVTTENQSPKVSLGQELTDLKMALDKGAISQSEYDRQKERLLRKH